MVYSVKESNLNILHPKELLDAFGSPFGREGRYADYEVAGLHFAEWLWNIDVVLRFEGAVRRFSGQRVELQDHLRISPEQVEIGGLMHDQNVGPNYWPDETPIGFVPDQQAPPSLCSPNLNQPAKRWKSYLRDSHQAP